MRLARRVLARPPFDLNEDAGGVGEAGVVVVEDGGFGLPIGN
jgi:hypothetical protein